MFTVLRNLIIYIIPLLMISTLPAHYLEVGQGIGVSSLNWNIGSGIRSSDVISELEWQDLTTWNSSLYAELEFATVFSLNFEGNYGKIFSGYNEDSDYSRNHRRGLYMYSHATANKGEIFDLSLSIGCCFTCQNLRVRPLLGFAFDEQHVRMDGPGSWTYYAYNDPYQSEDYVVTGRIDGLHSSYKTEWWGPWVGFDAVVDCGRLHWLGAFEFHLLDYSANGHWNLRDEFIGDFKHEGLGEGVRLKLGANYDLPRGFSIGVLGTFTEYSMINGIDKTPYYDYDGVKVIGQSRINEVNWHAFSFVINLGAEF